MANNRTERSKTDKSLARKRRELGKRRAELGSYDALAKKLGVNVRYVYDFIVKGRVPVSRRVRDKMGIDWVSKGAQVYRALSVKAREAGWQNWSEYRRAVLSGEVAIVVRSHNN